MTDVDPYVDGTDVFLNSLDLTSGDALGRAVANLSFAADVRQGDLEHLRSRTPAGRSSVRCTHGQVSFAGSISRSPQRFIESYSAGV
jgi:hypothetical protein